MAYRKYCSSVFLFSLVPIMIREIYSPHNITYVENEFKSRAKLKKLEDWG